VFKRKHLFITACCEIAAPGIKLQLLAFCSANKLFYETSKKLQEVKDLQ